MTYMEVTMKKSLSAIIVILFSFFGATAFAAKIDSNVKKNIIKTNDDSSGSNGRGGRNGITRDI